MVCFLNFRNCIWSYLRMAASVMLEQNITGWLNSTTFLIIMRYNNVNYYNMYNNMQCVIRKKSLLFLLYTSCPSNTWPILNVRKTFMWLPDAVWASFLYFMYTWCRLCFDRNNQFWSKKSYSHVGNGLQPFTKYFRLTLVSTWNSALREILNFYFSSVFG